MGCRGCGKLKECQIEVSNNESRRGMNFGKCIRLSTYVPWLNVKRICYREMVGEDGIVMGLQW